MLILAALVVTILALRVAFLVARALDDRFKVEVVPAFFSRAEHAFYNDLLGIAADLDLVVFPKVGLKDLFKDRNGARRGQFFRYAQLHVDFLLVSPGSFEPVLGIELDGESHLSAIQQTRDIKKDRVFKAAGLPLVRFRNGARAREVRERLAAFQKNGAR